MLHSLLSNKASVLNEFKNDFNEENKFIDEDEIIQTDDDFTDDQSTNNEVTRQKGKTNKNLMNEYYKLIYGFGAKYNIEETNGIIETKVEEEREEFLDLSNNGELLSEKFKFNKKKIGINFSINEIINTDKDTNILTYKIYVEPETNFSKKPYSQYIKGDKIRIDENNTTLVYFEMVINYVHFENSRPIVPQTSEKSISVIIYPVIILTTVNLLFRIDNKDIEIKLENIDKVLHTNYYGNECVILLKNNDTLKPLPLKFQSYRKKFVFFQYLSDVYHVATKTRLRIWVKIFYNIECIRGISKRVFCRYYK